MRDIIIKSTSRSSAECTDITLRKTTTTRLVFRPMLVENPNDPDAAVKGLFVFQRKGRNDEWTDIVEANLNTLHKDEGYKLELHSAEMLILFSELKALYEIHSKSGIPSGEKHYIASKPHLDKLSELEETELNEILNSDRTLGSDLFIKLLKWTLATEAPRDLVSHLTSINPNQIQDLNIAFGIQNMRNALESWQNDQTNDDEEHWQKLLSSYSWVLEQLFSWPMTIVKGKAYVGGKNIFNTGGHIVDYLVKNTLTSNVALVEIKTPVTPLLGSLYRTSIYNVSTELTGSLSQVLVYRQSLLNEYQSLTSGQQDIFHAFDPKCVVIIGNSAELESEIAKRQTFELFRSQLSDVTVITFDELFMKTEQQINLLEQPLVVTTEVPF